MKYRRSQLPDTLDTGILHFGLGAFHRAHQAPYTEDAVLASGGSWGIEAIAMRTPVLAETLKAQNHRYTLIEQHPDGPQAREISVIRKCHVLPRDTRSVLSRLAHPNIHIVTITVTEKGYGLQPGAAELDLDHPAIAHDLAGPSHPTGLLGLLSAGLNARRANGVDGLTILSCDNLPSNGQTLRDGLFDFAQRTGSATSWIAETCTFPNSMVDRITPAATNETQRLAYDLAGRDDNAAVETEPFRQWVIEDNFAGPRPAWDAAGAQIVPDVAPYELMKLRMLNGAHSLIAYLGTISGLTFVRDVMAEPDLRRLIRAHMDAAAETLPDVPGMNTADYADALIQRFANPAIDHRCVQIAMDGSQKMPQRIFFAAKDRLDRGQRAETFAFAAACWLHHIERSATDALNDPMAEALKRAMQVEECVAAIGALPGLAETGLFTRQDWVMAVTSELNALREIGIFEAARRSLTGASR